MKFPIQKILRRSNDSKLTWADGPQNREMLEWYRQLLQLRKEYVVNAERTADAQYADSLLTMQVPAQDPKLVVIANLKNGVALPPLKNGWRELLYSAEEGYEVTVRTPSLQG